MTKSPTFSKVTNNDIMDVLKNQSDKLASIDRKLTETSGRIDVLDERTNTTRKLIFIVAGAVATVAGWFTLKQ